MNGKKGRNRTIRKDRVGFGLRGMLAILLSLSLLGLPLGSPGSVSAASIPAASVAAAKTLQTTAAGGSSPTVSERLGGSDRYATAAKISQAGWPGTAEYAVLAAGMNENLVDALTAAPLAAKLKAPILLTQGTELNTYAKAELTRLGVKTVYVTSGTAVITQPILDDLKAMQIIVKPLGGKDRFETSVNMAKELESLGTAVSKIVVTTGANNADALSVASIAAAKGMPILLTNLSDLPPSVKEFLDGRKADMINSYIIGGTGVVGDTVKGLLPGQVERYAGANRYDTNLEVLKHFANELKYQATYVANGEDASMADALAGSPLAAQNASPILLSNLELSANARDYAKLNLSPKVVALGGEGVVPAKVLNDMTSSLDLAETGATKGATDAAQPEQITDNLKISAANVTLKNVIADYSIYVQGDKATLSQVKVRGTVFLDPGEQGTVNLDGVSAARVVVLSGANNSIHLKNVTTGALNVASSTPVRVETSGTTSVTNTVVSSAAILDAVAGSFGKVEIAKLASAATTPNSANPSVGEAVVELRGNFPETITVSGQASVKAAANANIPQMNIAPESKEQKITLQGAFQTVNINKAGEVALAENAKVTSTVVNSGAILNAASGSFGQVEIAKTITSGTPSGSATPGKPPVMPVVELRGTFDQKVLVSGQATVKAALNANIAKVEIAPESKEQKIILDGTFAKVEVNTEAKVELSENAKVIDAVTNAKADFLVPQTAIVEKLDPKNTGTTASGGGDVNGTTTAKDSTTPPVVVTPPVTPPPAPGGGSSGGGSSDSGGSSTVTATPITGADVKVTKGSIDFNYTFAIGTGTNVQRVSYADVLKAPYYLDPQASTVTLANSHLDLAQATPVKLSELFVFNDAGEGVSEFSDLGAFTDKFPDFKPKTGAVEVGFPTQIKLHLVSKTLVNGQTVANAWSYDTDWINFASDDIKVFTLYGDVQALQGQMSNMIGDTVAADKATLELPAQLGGGLGSDPTSTVGWTSDNQAISVSSAVYSGTYSAAVTHGAADINVTLTATITSGTLTETKAFPVTVKAEAKYAWLNITGSPYPGLSSSSARAPEYTLDSSDNVTHINGYVNVDVRVKNAGFDSAVFKIKYDAQKYSLLGAYWDNPSTSQREQYTPTFANLSDLWQEATFTVTRNITAPNDSSGASIMTLQISAKSEGTLPLNLVSAQGYNSSVLPADVMAGSCSLELSSGGSAVAWTPDPINSGLTLFTFTNKDNAVYLSDFYAHAPLTGGKIWATLSDNSKADVTALPTTSTDVYGGYFFNIYTGATGYSFTKDGYDEDNLSASGATVWHQTSSISPHMFMSGNPGQDMIYATANDITLNIARNNYGSPWGTDSNTITAKLYDGSGNTVYDALTQSQKQVYCTALTADSMSLAIPHGLQLPQGSMFAEYNMFIYQNNALLGRVYLSVLPPDTVAPVLQSAEVSGSTLTLTYNEGVDSTTVPAAGDFAVSVNSSPATVSTVAVSGITVTLTLSSAVSAGDTVTVSYTKGTSPVQDASGNTVANLTGQTVTNSTAGLSSDTTLKVKTGYSNVVAQVYNTETYNGNYAVIVFSGTTAAQLKSALESTDGSVQTYTVKDSGNILKADASTLVDGDLLLVTSAAGGWNTYHLFVTTLTQSTAPDVNSIVVNNNSAATDVVTVGGLATGDVVKIYSTADTTQPLASGNSGINNYVRLADLALEFSGGSIWVSVTSTGKAESVRTEKTYAAEQG
ncbi:hypothetical protein JCM15765_26030 [Paradesulfitobacterium aromaticivorans]